AAAAARGGAGAVRRWVRRGPPGTARRGAHPAGHAPGGIRRGQYRTLPPARRREHRPGPGDPPGGGTQPGDHRPGDPRGRSGARGGSGQWRAGADAGGALRAAAGTAPPRHRRRPAGVVMSLLLLGLLLTAAAAGLPAQGAVNTARAAGSDAAIRIWSLTGSLRITAWTRDSVHVQGRVDPGAGRFGLGGTREALKLSVEPPVGREPD